MKLQLISCAVFQRELEFAVARSPHHVVTDLLPQGLHDLPAAAMRARVQAAIDAVPEDREAVLLGYGLCNHGLSGLQARTRPLVLPRAHDCITLFFGSKERYSEYFFSHPGTYFLTSGWLEHGPAAGELREAGIPHQLGLDRTLTEYIKAYGEDNGPYLFEMLSNHAPHYRHCTFIEMGVEPDDRFKRAAQDRARRRGWQFSQECGHLGLFQDLVNGAWRPEAFLVVPPGGRIEPTHGADIVRVAAG